MFLFEAWCIYSVRLLYIHSVLVILHSDMNRVLCQCNVLHVNSAHNVTCHIHMTSDKKQCIQHSVVQ